MPDPFRLAVVGCGAVTKASLLPVLAGHERISVVALVDRDATRARELADAYGIARVESDVSAIRRADADGIVLATPPAHHAQAAIELSGLGFHVFVEKPMAIRGADALAMVEASQRAGTTLAVGLYRRLLPVSRLLRGVIEQGLLGRPVAVDIEEGGEYSWQLATLSVLTREGGGGGVLIDLGTHLIDQLLFVLPGQVRLMRYADNARGGIETDCEVRLEIDSQWGPVPARIELSRTRQLRGTVRVTCERGTLELVRSDFCHLRVVPTDSEAADAVAGRARRLRVVGALGQRAGPGRLQGVPPGVRRLAGCHRAPVRAATVWPVCRAGRAAGRGLLPEHGSSLRALDRRRPRLALDRDRCRPEQRPPSLTWAANRACW